jgi:hypothetical protein
LTGRDDIIVNVGGSSWFVVGANATAGEFTLISGVAAGASVTTTFKYHVQDVWTGSDSALRRAKVISTSDPAGEWVTIGETASATNTSTSATSRLFSGTVFLSSDASAQGTNDDGVWVQDSDTLTVQYVNSSGTVLDSDTMIIDGVKPTISNIVPADGTITNVANPTVTFDVTDAGSGISTSAFSTDITLKINGWQVSASKISYQAIAGGFRAIFAQGTSWTETNGNGGFSVSDSTEFSLEMTATDQAGNTQTVSGTSANLTIDKTKPVLSSASTGAANTAVSVTFSDVSGLDAGSVASNGSDFTVAGTAVIAAAVDPDNINKVNLTVTSLASDARPVITVTGTVNDKAGNSVTANSQVTATDGIKPDISGVVIDKSLAANDDTVAVTFSTDENMAIPWPRVSLNGPSGATSNGFLSVTQPTPNNFSASDTVAVGDLTGTYGVSIQAKDLGNNQSDNLTRVVGEFATFSGSIVTLANGPVGDADFNGAVGPSDVTVLVNGTTTGVTVTSVDASSRTIALSAAPASGSLVQATYSYIANDTFEIDLSAPTVAFSPVNGANVSTGSPVVSIIFDDDEYPGDSFKTVTVTSATLTKPDSSVVDILSSLTTSDNITFTFAAANLDTGLHTLTVSGSDVAGNLISGAQSTFTVTNIAPVVVAEPDIAPDEGSTFNGTLASFTDTNASDTHTATIDWGDGTAEAGSVVESGGSGTVSGSHVYADDDGGPFTVTVTVTDDSNVSDSDTLLANVTNVDPVADAGANQSVAVGATFVLTPTTFTDVGALDTHSALIVWGDGHSGAGTVDQTNDTVSGSHTYAGDGTFPLTVVIIDDDGGFAFDAIEVRVGSGIPQLPTAILSATQWALMLLTLAFGLLFLRKRRAPGGRTDA